MNIPLQSQSTPPATLYVAGSTDSSDLPVTQGAFQNMLGGGTDAFVMKIGPSSAPAVALSPDSLQYSSQAVGSTSPAQTAFCFVTWEVRRWRFHRSRRAETLLSWTTAEPAYRPRQLYFVCDFTPTAAGTRLGFDLDPG